jgi:pimeloyl-ACP methyl ester carboxylesterase
VLHGSDDHIAPVERGEELARLAGSALVRLAGSGHEPESRIPDVVNTWTGAFLDALPRPVGAASR